MGGVYTVHGLGEVRAMEANSGLMQVVSLGVATNAVRLVGVDNLFTTSLAPAPPLPSVPLSFLTFLSLSLSLLNSH